MFVAFPGGTSNDPIMVTMDGYKYAYRGIGEYWLIHSPNFLLQGRFVQALDTSGKKIEGASVMGAVAATARTKDGDYIYKDMQSSRIHIGVNNDRTGKLLI